MRSRFIDWFGVAGKIADQGRKARRRRQARRPLLLERLEGRAVLSAPAPFTLQNVSVSADQFAGAQASGSGFLGVPNFSASGSTGGISDFLGSHWGAEANLNMSGQVGVDVTASASGGQVNANYGKVTLSQNYAEPTQFNQYVTFDPQNTGVSYPNGGSFFTTEPAFNAAVDLDAALSGDLSGTIAVGSETSGDIPLPSFNVHQPLYSVGLVNGALDLKYLGQDVTTLAQMDLSHGLSMQQQVVDDPIPVYLSESLTGQTSPLALHQALSVGVGLVSDGAEAEGSGDLAPQGSTSLGNMDESAPTLSLNSSGADSRGVMTATAQSTIGDLNVDMGPLLSSLLGYGVAGAALTGTDTVSLAGVNLSFTPVSFQLGPNLRLVQTGSITPVNTFTYTFTDQNGNSISADVYEDGTDLGNIPSVAFTPGKTRSPSITPAMKSWSTPVGRSGWITRTRSTSTPACKAPSPPDR